MLAIALSSLVAISVVTYYSHIHTAQENTIIFNQVVQSAEKSKAEATAGITTDDTTVINGISMNSTNGITTLTSMKASQCESLEASLQTKGTTTSSCSNNNPDLNNITFTPTNDILVAASSEALSSGTPDVGATNTLTDPTLTGTTDITASSVNMGTTSGGYTSTENSGGSTFSLAGSGTGTVVTGGVVTSPSSGTPPSSTGNATMSCAYRLSNDSDFAPKSLGTRATSCTAGYVSTSDQTGTETFSCPDPSAGVAPVGTDTWTGGSCGVACVPLAEQTRDVGCPAGDVGNHYQHRDSSCPAPSGSPVWGSWYDYSGGNTCSIDTSCAGYPGESWNGSNCQITCNTLKSEESPATGTETRAKPAADCPSGTTPTGNETRTYSYTCPSTFAIPTQVWTGWSGGSCDSYPIPAAPTVLSSMWSGNVVISRIDSSVDHIDIGITCGVNPPQSQFDKTVQSVPASATTNGENTTTETYFIPTGIPYTVMGGFTASPAMTAISKMTAALPESLCEMGGGYGGLWAVDVQARTCNAENQCSSWSAPVAQFCEFNRC